MSATNIGDERRRAALEFPPQCREMIRRGALVALNIALMQEVPELSVLPVIFISAYGRDETVARALEAGAADYIVKPFSPTELVARVRAVLRRHDEPEPIVLGALAIDYGRRRVTVAGDAVDLTPTEYELLRVLSLDAGRVMTYDTLLRRVWSGRHGADANLVRIVVRNLRRKLGDDAADPVWIFNQRGVGYRMAEPRAGDP
ncbi:MAG: response regulator transcription factor [Paracoccaceae bacterium]|nr:response regulator transcription factor [Paracoccaceae bacterium]